MPLAVCATPIGNLDDVTLRVLATLRVADVVLCEDTRHTAVLLRRHGVTPARLVSYHRHNEARRVDELLPLLAAGRLVALVSDAGLPGINDAGPRVIDAARDAGVPVTVLPGASAVETALVATGWTVDQYRFLGWIPRRDDQRAALWVELSAWSHPAVGFESPQRLPATLRSLAAADGERSVAVCRELTKRHEQVVRGRVADVAEAFERPPRGEVTLVIGPGTTTGTAADAAVAVAAVHELVAAGAPRRVAADVVSGLTGVARNTLYRRSL